jgi:hypothetical protein
MECEYITTFADYKAAQKLYLRHRPSARRRFLGWMYGLPIITLLLVVATWHESGLENSEGFGLAAWLTFCAAMATLFVVVLRPWNLRRCFRKMRKASGLTGDTPTRFTFDANGVVSAVPNRSEGRFFWTAIEDFAEDSSIALLFIGKKRFLFVPKRAMNEPEWEALRQTVRAKLGATYAD